MGMSAEIPLFLPLSKFLFSYLDCYYYWVLVCEVDALATKVTGVVASPSIRAKVGAVCILWLGKKSNGVKSRLGLKVETQIENIIPVAIGH